MQKGEGERGKIGAGEKGETGVCTKRGKLQHSLEYGVLFFKFKRIN